MRAKNPYERFAEVYDAYVRADFHEDYYHLIKKVLNRLKFKPKTILDLACGTGKLAKLFLDHGYVVEGLDISENMLRIAKKRGLKVYQGDMVDFKLGVKYDLIICAYDSLNYILEKSDLQKCFNSVNKHLNFEGIFIFDMNSDYKINVVLPTFKTDYHKIGDTELIWLNAYQRNMWVGELVIFEKTRNGKYRRFYDKHVEKAYKMNTIKKMLEKANFEILENFSDYKFKKIEKDSKRWFFVCKRVN